MHKCLTIILLFAFGYSNAQVLDSLLNQFNKYPKEDSLRTYLSIEIAWEYLENDIDSSLIFANKAKKIAIRNHNDIQIIDAYNILGNIYRYQSEFDLAIQSFNSALEILKNGNGTYQKYCSIYTNLGNVYNSQKNFSLAIYNYKKALDIAEKNNDDKYLLNIYNNLIGVYQMISQFETGMNYSKKALELCEKNNDEVQQAFVNSNIGLIFLGQNKYKEAIEYLNNSVVVLEKHNYTYALPAILNNLGIAYRNLSDYNNSIKAYQKALKNYEEMNDSISVSMVLMNISTIYYDLKNYRKSIELAEQSNSLGIIFSDTATLVKSNNIISDNYSELKLLSQANDYIQKSKDLLTNSSDIALIISTLQSYKKFKIYSGDYKTALNITDSLISLEAIMKLDEYENNISFFKVELDLAAKEQEIQKLNTQNELKQKENDVKDAQLKVKRNQQFALFGGLLLVIIFAVFMYNRFKVTQRQNLVIEEQKHLVENQKHIIEEKHKEVLDSIRYAKRIQDALLTPKTYIERNIKRLKEL